jgi:hypothetical protein
MIERSRALMYSGGHKGTEAEFGRDAARWGIREVTFSFKGHQMEWSQDVRVLSEDELRKGDISMEIVSARLGRTYTRLDAVRRVVQSMFHIVTNAYQVFAVGWIQPDRTVRGGTGWGVELAKFFNRRVSVFDQGQEHWYTWTGTEWQRDLPTIGEKPFAATGTRHLTDAGRAAIQALFERSFGPAPALPEPPPPAPAPAPAPPRARPAAAKKPAARKPAARKPATKKPAAKRPAPGRGRKAASRQPSRKPAARATKPARRR